MPLRWENCTAPARIETSSAAPGRLRRCRQLLGEAAAVDEFHREVRTTLDVARVVHLHDVRVPHAGEGLGLPPKTPQLVRTGKSAREQHLDRDRAIECMVPSPVDHTHATGTQHRLHPMAGYVRQSGGL